jgi:peroxiredoxin Q/BCP
MTRFCSRGGRTNVKTMLAEGTSAPDFTVPDQDGNAVTLSARRGGWVLLWWYPKADTPG